MAKDVIDAWARRFAAAGLGLRVLGGDGGGGKACEHASWVAAAEIVRLGNVRWDCGGRPLRVLRVSESEY